MPLYTYTCSEHGLYDLSQGMNDRHIGVCSECRRVFHVPGVAGDLPTTRPKLGNTRQELLKNLEKEGFEGKGAAEEDRQHFEETREKYGI